MHISTIPEDFNYFVLLVCSLKYILGMLVLKTPQLNPRDNIGMILSTLLTNSRNYAIGMISRSLEILSMYVKKVKDACRFSIGHHALHKIDIMSTNRRKKKETDKKQKDRKDQAIRRIYNRNDSYKPFALQYDIYIFLPTVKCFQEYAVHRKLQKEQVNAHYGVL